MITGEIVKSPQPQYFNRKTTPVGMSSKVTFGFDSENRTNQYFEQLEKELGQYLEVIREDACVLILRSKDKTKYLIEFNSEMYGVLARI